MTVSADDRVANVGRARSMAGWPAKLRRLQGMSVGRIAGLTIIIVVLAFLTVYPLSMLLYGSLHSTPPGMTGVFNLEGYQEVLTRQSLLALLNTVGISLAKTIPSLILAVLLAWVLARTDTPFRCRSSFRQS
jgi:iron(III) transport system permease protein